MSYSDVASPGGWLQVWALRITKWLVIGAIAIGGERAAVSLYGTLQGAQASHFCEATLTSATKDTVTYSCLNPLPEGWSGAVLATTTNGVFVNENTAPKTRLHVCTASGAAQPCPSTAGGANVMSGVILEGAKRWLALSATGGMTVKSPVVLAPRDYLGAAKRYLNATFKLGSGATVSGEAPAFLRIEIMPCNLSGVGC